MVQVGHALLGTRGEVLSLDDGFCEILGTDASDIVGRSVLDVTIPADRGTCAALMQNLVATREPFHVAKRFQHADGSEVWVSNTVSIIALGDGAPMLVSTIMPIDPPIDRRSPAAMLECAKFLLSSRRDRSEAFGTTIFAEPAWDMMLTAYIAEAEGGSLDHASLSRAAAVPQGAGMRWVRALVQEGILDVESRGDGHDLDAVYRLSASTHAQFEAYLAGLMFKKLPQTSLILR